jgi:hypothetical protein
MEQLARPHIDADLAILMAINLPDGHHHARLGAVSAPQRRLVTYALPISSCGLRLDDEAVRVAVGLRLGAKLCDPPMST